MARAPRAARNLVVLFAARAAYGTAPLPPTHIAFLASPPQLQDRSFARLLRYMLDDNLDESEAFLRDYMLNAMWKRPAKAETAAADQPEGWEGAEDVGPGQEEDGEEGQTFSDREDDFERAHNFRFEEAGADRVVSHPRQVRPRTCTLKCTWAGVAAPRRVLPSHVATCARLCCQAPSVGT